MIKILKSDERKTDAADWGKLVWNANLELGNSDKLTTGQCIIKPGCENPRHIHPNCDEILYVLKGRILHSYGDEEGVIMDEGMTITIPEGIYHNAKNIGEETAVLMITFSSANRQTIGE